MKAGRGGVVWGAGVLGTDERAKGVEESGDEIRKQEKLVLCWWDVQRARDKPTGNQSSLFDCS